MKNQLIIISFLLTFCNLAKSQKSDSLTFVSADWVHELMPEPLVWQRFHFKGTLFNSNQNINIIKYSLNDTTLQIGFASAEKKLVETPKIAQKVDALVAINGSFFDMRKGGAVDLIKIDGKILDTTLLPKGKRSEHQHAAITIHKGQLRIVQGNAQDLKWDEHLIDDNIMVTGPLLLLAGDTISLKQTPFALNRHPRSCIGINAKNELILMTIDGRNVEAQGVSLPELRQILLWLGCRDAINLDGGGSTTLYVRDQLFDGVVNMPADNQRFDHEGVRKVSNILYLKKKPKPRTKYDFR
jgi:exopolysaccharide biosynthesis protein